MNAMTPLYPLAAGDAQPFKLRIEDYELLERAGAFHGQRVELVDGRIIVVNAQLQAHIAVKNRLGRRLQRALEEMASPLEAIIEGSVALSPNDLPDPDILVASITTARDYIRPSQIAIVIEVADSSLRRDLGEKRDLYARGGAPEYWVVDINGGQVHQFWQVEGGRYACNRSIPLAGELRSLTLPDLAIDGSGIL